MASATGSILSTVASAAATATQTFLESSIGNKTTTSLDSSNPAANASTRPSYYKAIGIALALSSGLFIGTSFVLKKYGLLKANKKYHEVAGEGYGYLKNCFWWSGMTLMILGELCNFVAYAFTDAILVTPLGALSVVTTTILSAVVLKERLSMIGKISCFLCLIGAVVIAMNAPATSSVANIQDMQAYVLAPGFLSYAGVVISATLVCIFYAGPRWGNKNMFVYISICSWVGGLSVVATQGLGAAIVAQAGGNPQYNKWFSWVLLVFVVCTLLTEIVFLNKALNLFNAAMVTPTYYVYFTSTTIITSSVLFQGFKGTPVGIANMVLGFLTICAGVVLLQLSKSAKDVPDVAVFKGELDQVHMIAEQEEPETEPRADAIRGAAAIIRRFSVTRQQRELEEVKRLHEDKMAEHLEPVGEDAPAYEWDGLRRRRTTLSTRFAGPRHSFVPPVQVQHPPLGMTHFPTEAELEQSSGPSVLSSIVGSIRGRARTTSQSSQPLPSMGNSFRNSFRATRRPDASEGSYVTRLAGDQSNINSDYNTERAAKAERYSSLYRPSLSRDALKSNSNMDAGNGPHSAPGGDSVASSPTGGRRALSFHNVLKWPHSAGAGGSESPSHDSIDRTYASSSITEEEHLGLVKGDSKSMSTLPRLDKLMGNRPERYSMSDKVLTAPASLPALPSMSMAERGRGITPIPLPPRPYRAADADSMADDAELTEYQAMRVRWNDERGRNRSPNRPPTRRRDSGQPNLGNRG